MKDLLDYLDEVEAYHVALSVFRKVGDERITLAYRVGPDAFREMVDSGQLVLDGRIEVDVFVSETHPLGPNHTRPRQRFAFGHEPTAPTPQQQPAMSGLGNASSEWVDLKVENARLQVEVNVLKEKLEEEKQRTNRYREAYENLEKEYSETADCLADAEAEPRGLSGMLERIEPESAVKHLTELVGKFIDASATARQHAPPSNDALLNQVAQLNETVRVLQQQVSNLSTPTPENQYIFYPDTDGSHPDTPQEPRGTHPTAGSGSPPDAPSGSHA